MSNDHLSDTKTMDVYVSELGDNRDFNSIRVKGIEKDILKEHFIEKKSVSQLSHKYGISQGSISGFLLDYKLANYDDSMIEETALLDSENHLGIMTMFFANAMYLAKEGAMVSILAKKTREEIARKLAKEGAMEVFKDTDLMNAWSEVNRKTAEYTSNSGKTMETYLKLMEKVLDKQRELAFVKVLFDIVQKLEPRIAEKLHNALVNDDYARAVMQSLSGEALMKQFNSRQKESIPEIGSYTESLLLEND